MRRDSSKPRHSRPAMRLFFLLFRKMDGGLPFIGVLFFVAVKAKPDEACDCGNKNEHLQCECHARLLSTSMPAISNPMPRAINNSTISQPGRFGSKSQYRGAKTITNVPASRSASPIISSVYFFSGKVTSVLLSRLGQFLVLQIVGRDQFEHGITEQKRVLPVVEAPHHFVEVGR
jgi:hypothetical protein